MSWDESWMKRVIMRKCSGEGGWWLSHMRHLQRTPSRPLWPKGREGNKSSGQTGLLLEVRMPGKKHLGSVPGTEGPGGP